MICSKMKALSVSSSSSLLMILLLLLFQISLAQRSFRQQSLGVEASSSSSSSPSAWKSRCNCCGRVVPTHTAFISKVGDTRGRRRVVTDCNTGSIGWAYKKTTTTTTTSSGSSSRNNKHHQQQQRLHRLHFTSNNNCPIPRSNYELFLKELDYLVKLGVLEPVSGLVDYAAPTFLVPKPNGTARWVSDFRALNKIIKRKVYPLPKINDILKKRSGYSFLTKLDISMQFYTFELDDASKELCTIATPFGLY